MWLSQRFYYTLNRRSKIIHLKSDAFSSEMHLVFLNAQKSWLWIWFLCSKKCDLNWCRQPGFIWFWKKVNFCFQHSTAKIWQHKHRKRPTPPASAQTSPQNSYFIPLWTHCAPQPPDKSAFAHGQHFLALVAIRRDQVKGLWSAVRLHLLPEAPSAGL